MPESFDIPVGDPNYAAFTKIFEAFKVYLFIAALEIYSFIEQKIYFLIFMKFFLLWPSLIFFMSCPKPNLSQFQHCIFP